MKSIINQLYRKVWITRGCRFNAHARFETHSSISNLTMLLLNIYIIAINLLPFSSKFEHYFPSIETGVVTIILTILMLSVGQFVSAKEYSLKAARFHNCSKELTSVYNKLVVMREFDNDVSLKDIEQISSEYESIISKYEENHREIDYDRFKSDNFTEFSIKHPNLYRIWISLVSFVKIQLIYWLLMVTPILIFIYYIFQYL